MLEPDFGMSDHELAAYLSDLEQNTVGNHDDTIATEQERALDYYYRRMPDLPAQEGCSSVVDGTVGIVIDNALAAILKPFVSSDEVVSFAPRGPEDVETAEQATEFCNYVFNIDNPGFSIMHDWFKDALLTKVGIVKCWWEEQAKVVREQVLVDNDIALAMARMDPAYGGEEPQPDGTVLVSMARTESDGRVRIVNIPPEEWEISKFTRSLGEADYVAHVPKNATRSDLIEMGFDPALVETLPAVGQSRTHLGSDTGRENARWGDEGGDLFNLGTPHLSRELVAIRDEYVRVDYDGDGIAELRRVIRCGETILFNEEVDALPFAVLCPVPMPHKVYGLSLADQVVDLQKISTAILRQTLDNLYKTNNPRPVIGEGAERQDGSTQDSIADAAPGAEILVRDTNAFRFDSVPFFARESFGMLEYVESQQEARTGIARSGQGMDPNALKSTMTATEVSMINQGRNARAEMIARIFAETGVKDLFKIILRLLVEYQPKARMVKLRNKWVDIDPSGWPVDMDVEISVGLGMGDKMEQLATADSLLRDYAELMQSPFAAMVTPANVFNALKRKYNAAGIKNVDDFITEPGEGSMAQQPEGPSPEEIKAQAEMQVQLAKMEGERQLAELRIQLQAQEAEAKQQLEREKAEFEARLAREKAQFEADLALAKMRSERQLKSEALSQNRPGGDLDK